ncbi:MAG: hypothetical protein U9N87_04535, partial [Planctomycetota bacterium]|nr:hypothetical protein [Planctomycetota bacterium]
DAQEVPDLVRMALFSIDYAEGDPSEEHLENVTGRLLQAIHRHLDEPQKAFDKWFYGPNNSIVKQIAQQKLKQGGKLKRKEVRQAILHLGWQAYEHVGQCINALMQTIKNSMPDPLSDEEKRLFEHMYESRPYYGGLPAAILVERMDFLRPAILAIWEQPEEQKHVRVLYRMMWFYAAMVSKRREADRLSKKRTISGPPISSDVSGVVDQATEEDVYSNMEEDVYPNMEDEDAEDDRYASNKQYIGSTPLIVDFHSPVSAEKGPFEEVAEHIRQLHQIDCANACGVWEYKCERPSEELITIVVRCECGNVAWKKDMTFNEFAEHAENILKWKRTDRPS